MDDFISLLLERKKRASKISSKQAFAIKKCSTQRELIQHLFAAFPCSEFSLDDKGDFQLQHLPKAICTYLAALNKCINFISNKPNCAETSPYRYESQKMDISRRIRICTSPYFPLIFPSCDNQNGRPKYSNESNGFCHSIENKDTSMFPLNVHYTQHVLLYYLKVLERTAYSLKKNIHYCPYCMEVKLPVSFKKADGTIDKRKKNDIVHDFNKYKKDSGIYAFDISTDELPFPFNLLSQECQKTMLQLGGPAVIELLLHMQDITYNNAEIKEHNRINSFFRNIYNDVIMPSESYNDNADNLEELFSYLSLEVIFNGSFLMYFCTSFCDNRHLISKLKKICPQQNYLLFLTNLYDKMNHIENPFIKCDLLDVIQSFIQSCTYNQMDANGKIYITNKRTNACKSFYAWENEINRYCNELIHLEKDMYRTYLSVISDSIAEPETKSLINEYKTLFQKSNLCSAFTQKRSSSYIELLPKITLSNYKYYSFLHNIWR